MRRWIVVEGRTGAMTYDHVTSPDRIMRDGVTSRLLFFTVRLASANFDRSFSRFISSGPFITDRKSKDPLAAITQRPFSAVIPTT